jgi:hypothetical protein
MYGKKLQVIRGVLAKREGERVKVLIKLLDGSQLDTVVGLESFEGPVKDIWASADMVWEISNSFAYIRGTDKYTKASNVVED